ncbi:MAG TPA: hypothetical protein DEF00_02060 [Candidatus Taylorbacteria bacterium]|nr:hypothetical protein [Candidatus Taylorbacteria bacterium]
MLIPVVVEPIVVPIPLLAIPVEIPDIEVAVRVAETYEAPSVPPPPEYSKGWKVFGISFSRRIF